MIVIYLAIAIAATALVYVLYRAQQLARRKNVPTIIAGHLTRRRQEYHGPRHVFFCFVDHFEPLWHGAGREKGIERVEAWRERYPILMDRFRDRGGVPPQHIFFYPQEEYIPECMEKLAELQRRRFGEVEIHLHHDRDTSDGFRQKILSFRDTLHREHGLLHVDPVTNSPVYAFIHGNWALDDSGLRGRFCGVRDEITILKETGCYADFTYPSAPDPTQPPIINRIYYATDDPLRPKSHHRGVDARYNTVPHGDLLLINGPLTFNWGRRKAGLLPAIENGDINASNAGTADRIDLWIRSAISVVGWPRWVFVKVHTHGTQERNSKLLLSERGTEMYPHLLARYNDGDRYVLHFVTAWQTYRCVKALEAGDDAEITRIESFEYDFDRV
jgi:hypothetical protein